MGSRLRRAYGAAGPDFERPSAFAKATAAACSSLPHKGLDLD